jgi:hypothetical protein
VGETSPTRLQHLLSGQARHGRILNALQSRRLVTAHYGKVKVQSLRAIEAFLDAAP